MSCFACDAIKEIQAGTNRAFIAELSESFVVLSNEQFYKGYCILLLKRHEEQLHLLDAARVSRLNEDVMRVALAVNVVCKPPRLNYANLGNAMPHIHWHVTPRYADDPMRERPIWDRSIDERRVELPLVEYQALAGALRASLTS